MALTRITKGVIKPNENYDTHNINSTGIVTAVGGNFTGDLTVGGVLTYEDVTSIDSVGIITAQKGIHVGAGVSVVGVSTFTDLVGFGTHITLQDNGEIRLGERESGGNRTGDLILRHDPSLYGNPFNVIQSNSGNLQIENRDTAGPTRFLYLKSDVVQMRTYTGNEALISATLNSDVKLYYDNSEKLATTSSGVSVTGHTNSSGNVVAQGNVTAQGNMNCNGGQLTFSNNSGGKIRFLDTNNNPDFTLESSQSLFQIYQTNGDPIIQVNSDKHVDINYNLDLASGLDVIGATNLRNTNIARDLDVDGHTNLDNVNIAGVTTSTGNIYADNYFGNSNLTLNNNSNVSINLTSTSTSGSSRIFFGDPDSALVGRITYTHNGDYMQFFTAYGERLRIDSNGRVGIGTDNPTKALQVMGTILKTRSDSGIGLIYLQQDGSYNGQIVINQNGGVTKTLLHSAGHSYFNGGNVGIASAIPAQRLDVDGIIRGSSYFQAGANSTASNNYHFGAEGNGDFRIYSGNYGAGNQKFMIDSSGNAIFGDATAPYASNSVTIHPASGMVNFGMDGRTSLVTSENSCYIYSGSGASGDMPAGSLVLQSRANENRNIFFATGSTPSIKWQIHGSSGALRSYNYLPAGGYSTSTANGYDIYLKLQGQVPTGTAGNAYTLFMTNAVSDAGAYILVIRSFEQSVTGGNLWSVRMVTSPFYVHYGSGNDGESVTIPYTYSGHANNATTQSQNGQGPITLKIHFYNGSAHTNGRIRITFHGFNYTGTNCDWYLYKLIDV